MEEKIIPEAEDERIISEAYQKLVDTYLASRHRKHTEIIDKAFNFFSVKGHALLQHVIYTYQRSSGSYRCNLSSVCG